MKIQSPFGPKIGIIKIPKKIIYCAEKSKEVQESLGFKKTKGVVIQNGYDVESFVQNTFTYF